MRQVLLITGGNSGIGYYIVEYWLERGNTAIVVDIECDNLELLKKKYKDNLYIINCDVADLDELNKYIDSTMQKVKTIDIAIHNACKCLFKNFESHSIHDYKQVLDINLMGAINITKIILPYMKKQKSGKIFYTSSGVGVTGYSNISSYAASKGAIEAFAKCMKIENSSNNISFHLIHPPLTDTNSSSPMPVPKEMKAKPKKVGYGIAKRLGTKKFILTPTPMDYISIKISYLFPLKMGSLLNKMTNRVAEAKRKEDNI